MARIATVLALCLALLPACTQVLGFERAKLEDAGAAGAAGTSEPAGSGDVNPDRGSDTCQQEPLPECETCLRGCGGAVQACTSDGDCRTELSTYAFCLGRQCSRSQEDCIFELDPPDLRECVSECAVACARTALVSLCELHCACMADVCMSEGVEDCMATCRNAPAELMACRYNHCDFASHQVDTARTLHCRHASNALPACASYEEVPLDDRTTCLDRQESLWACNVSSDCCSDDCRSGVCK